MQFNFTLNERTVPGSKPEDLHIYNRENIK